MSRRTILPRSSYFATLAFACATLALAQAPDPTKLPNRERIEVKPSELRRPIPTFLEPLPPNERGPVRLVTVLIDDQEAVIGEKVAEHELHRLSIPAATIMVACRRAAFTHKDSKLVCSGVHSVRLGELRAFCTTAEVADGKLHLKGRVARKAAIYRPEPNGEQLQASEITIDLSSWQATTNDGRQLLLSEPEKKGR